jgi:hypothetical protein
MNKRFFMSAAASGLLALAMGGHALAADVSAVVNAGFRTPGLSLVDRGHGSSMRNLVMEPGSDPNSIQLHFNGAQRVSIGPVSSLEIVSADGTSWHYRPELYQVVNGKRHNVAVSFHIVDMSHVTLRVKKFDATAPLILGPVATTEPNS